jgi:hypothetical protein
MTVDDLVAFATAELGWKAYGRTREGTIAAHPNSWSIHELTELTELTGPWKGRELRWAAMASSESYLTPPSPSKTETVIPAGQSAKYRRALPIPTPFNTYRFARKAGPTKYRV